MLFISSVSRQQPLLLWLQHQVSSQYHSADLCPNSTRRIRPDFFGDPGPQPDLRQNPIRCPTSPRTLSGRRLVCSISTCTDFVCGSGRSQTKSVGPCSWIWKRHDTTRPFLVRFGLKSRRAVAEISMTFLRNNWLNVVQFKHLLIDYCCRCFSLGASCTHLG